MGRLGSFVHRRGVAGAVVVHPEFNMMTPAANKGVFPRVCHTTRDNNPAIS